MTCMSRSSGEVLNILAKACRVRKVMLHFVFEKGGGNSG